MACSCHFSCRHATFMTYCRSIPVVQANCCLRIIVGMYPPWESSSVSTSLREPESRQGSLEFLRGRSLAAVTAVTLPETKITRWNSNNPFRARAPAHSEGCIAKCRTDVATVCFGLSSDFCSSLPRLSRPKLGSMWYFPRLPRTCFEFMQRACCKALFSS